jgi:hypothetical protein
MADEVLVVVEEFLVEGVEQDAADEVAVGQTHLLLGQQVPQHVGDILSGQLQLRQLAVVCIG